MNYYASLSDLTARDGAHASADSDLLMTMLEYASREIDSYCGRFFYTANETRYYDVRDVKTVSVGDVISVSSVTIDTEEDGTFDGESWTEGEDFVMYPLNAWPKMRLEETAWGDYCFYRANYSLKIVGVFGYGDGTSDPWSATSVTATVADATGTAVVLSADGTVAAGHTIKVGTEQMFVESVATAESVTTATVVRGVNGTTAAAHSGAAVSLASYPTNVRRAAVQLAIEAYAEAQRDGTLQNERIGDYSYQRFASRETQTRLGFMLGGLARL